MSNDNVQNKLEKDKPPRVHIKYEVDDKGAIEQRELPLVVGVMGDFSGTPKNKLPGLKERKFTEIDGDNFDKVLESAAPRLVLEVPNTLQKDGTDWKVELNFSSIADFEPGNVAKQVGPLRDLLEARQRLSDLRNKMYSSQQLETELKKILENTDHRQSLEEEVKARPAKPETTEE